MNKQEGELGGGRGGGAVGGVTLSLGYLSIEQDTGKCVGCMQGGLTSLAVCKVIISRFHC